MDRRAAAALLGIPLTATRHEARTAYLRLLSEAAGTSSTELDAAYATFTGDGGPSGAGGGPAVGYGSSTMTRTSGPNRRWVLPVIGVAAVGLILAGLSIAANNASNSSTTGATLPPREPSVVDTPREPNRGESGWLNTCWKDAGAPNSDGSIPLTQVECSWTTADWLAYRESLTEAGCANDYIQTPEGWYLCLRSN